MGLLVWLFFTPNVLNDPSASQTITSCQKHQNNANHLPSSLVKFVSPPSTYSSESVTLSNHKSKRNRIRKSTNKMRRQGGKKPTTTSHARGKLLVTASCFGNRSLATAIHVGDMSPSTAIHVRDKQLAAASHVGGNQPTIENNVGRNISTNEIFCRS